MMKTCLFMGALLLVFVAACAPATAFAVTPPCVPAPGSTTDPCAPQEYGDDGDDGGITLSRILRDTPTSMRSYVDSGPSLMAHIVVRATYLPDSVRCVTDGVRTRLAAWVTVSTSITAVDCFADIRANEYYVGSGPTELTVQVKWRWYGTSRHEDVVQRQWAAQIETVLREGGRFGNTRVLDGGIEGKERILFLAPSIDLSDQTWRVYRSWLLERLPDDTVIAVNPSRQRFLENPEYDFERYRSELEMSLEAFKTAVVAAHKARMTEYDGRIGEETDLPLIVGSVGELEQYYRGVGAYDDADNLPVMPPIACGRSVADATDNPGLVADCGALLAIKDTLRGSASLNWALGTAITEWDGVTIEGTPQRVTELRLYRRNMTGTIPAEITALTALHTLHLSENALTGGIPSEIGTMETLRELLAPGNQLSGPIPASLGSLAGLESISLGYNSLSGPIPAELGNLAALERLLLNHNDLSGPIPSEIGNLTTLGALWLASNDLSGDVPQALGNLTGLTSITLAGNNLTGCIPHRLAGMDRQDFALTGLPTCPAPGGASEETSTE